MTLVEKLRSFEGQEGDYDWRVEVWRADTNAKCNLRVRLKVYSVQRNPFIIPNGHSKVFQETEVASEQSVESTTDNLRERARYIAERYEVERGTVRGID